MSSYKPKNKSQDDHFTPGKEQIADVRPVDFSSGNKVVVSIEGLSKRYRLGAINHGTLAADLQSWWARLCGRQDPNINLAYSEKLNDPSEQEGMQLDGNNFWALKDISFDVVEGQVLGIIGKNGAGKSTLLKIMSRVTAPTQGCIKIKGRVASLLEVGTGFHPDLTGMENIYLNGAILGMNKNEISRKLEEIVAFSEIEKFVDTPVKRYSSGMYVRLAFAVAAHLDPEILIIDEVLAVGDVAFQKKCLGKMHEVSREGRTVLFVSHQLNMVESLCDESLIISNGRLTNKGETRQIISDYMMTNSSSESVNYGQVDTTNRRGTQNITITSFHIEDRQGNRWDTLMSGMDVVFVVNYKCKGDEKMENVDIGLSLHSLLNNQALMILYSSYTGKTFEVDKSEGTFRCEIDRFPFAEGRYKLNVRITVNGVEADFPLDGVGILDVVAGDFYRTGSKGFGPGSLFLADGRWEID